MQPFTAYRREGKLILEIDERQFLTDSVGGTMENLRLLDRERFLNFAVENMFTLTHDLEREGLRTSWWQRLSEALGKAAGATAQGVRQDQIEAPTCGCDPEEHDGG